MSLESRQTGDRCIHSMAAMRKAFAVRTLRGGRKRACIEQAISLFPECSKLPETKVKVQEVSLSSSFPSRMPWRRTWTGVNLKECVLCCEEEKKRRTELRRAPKDFKGSVGRRLPITGPLG